MSPPALRPGAAFDGRYRLEGPIDDFGVGECWRARDGAAEVFLKLLPPLAGADLGRFEALGRALTAMRHRGVLATLRHGVAQGRPYLVHEPFAGVSLAKGLALARAGQHLLAPGVLANLLDRACEAVDAAHRASPPLVHGGLMPGSVVAAMLGGRLDVRVIDFGLAQVFGDRLKVARATEYASPSREDDPERAEPADDVFALGSVVMEAVTDRRNAQPGVGTVGNLSAVAKRRADLPAALMAVGGRATRIDARQRYADVAALREALAAAWSPDSRPAPDEAPAAPSGVAGVAAEYTSWVRFSEPDEAPAPVASAPAPVAPAPVAPPVIAPPAPAVAFVAPPVDLSATVVAPPPAAELLGATTKLPPQRAAPAADLGATYVVRTPAPSLPATQAIEQFEAPAPPPAARPAPPQPHAAPSFAAPPAPAPYAAPPPVAPRMYGVAPASSPTEAPPPRGAGRAVWIAVGVSMLLLSAVGVWLAARG